MSSLAENMGLVHKMAKKVWGRVAAFDTSLEYEDLFQEAQAVYVKAETGFDPQRAVKFSTYASQAILHRLNYLADTAIQEARFEVSSLQKDKDGNDVEIFELMEQTLAPSTFEDDVIKSDYLGKIFEKLSPVAKVLFRETYFPSELMINQFRAKEAYLKKIGKSRKRYFYLNTVAEFLLKGGLSEESVNKAKRDILAIGENVDA